MTRNHTYFISDCHFGHEAVIRMENRPFKDAAAMDAEMIYRWNYVVGPYDKVYILGDMFMRHEDPLSVLTQLRGIKCLITGNHENWFDNLYREDCTKYAKATKSFLWVQKYNEVPYQHKNLVLFHYPMISYPHERKSNGYMIHGHIHSHTNAEYFPLIANRERILNACVEINDYTPVTFEQLVENNKIFKERYFIEHPEERDIIGCK